MEGAPVALLLAAADQPLLLHAVEQPGEGGRVNLTAGGNALLYTAIVQAQIVQYLGLARRQTGPIQLRHNPPLKQSLGRHQQIVEAVIHTKHPIR